MMIQPGQTLGILGGGQLGRYFTLIARQRGYRVIVLDPKPESPAAQIADRHLCAEYTDRSAWRTLGEQAAAFTTEFENVPATALEYLASYGPVRPAAAAVRVAQDRIREKAFLDEQGLPTPRHRPIRSPEDLIGAGTAVAPTTILKRAALGYDGKGQWVCTDEASLAQAFHEADSTPCLLEEKLALTQEISVLVVRHADGSDLTYPVAENLHERGILSMSLVPARLTPERRDQAQRIARRLAAALDYVGVLAVEFFLTETGELLVNEIAPRPHNSGHYTLDACRASQFEQQLRVLCDLPPAVVHCHTAAAMINLLGDLWAQGDPDWGPVLRHPRAALHLYGKHTPEPGRKMGHVTVLADTVDAARSEAESLRRALDPHGV